MPHTPHTPLAERPTRRWAPRRHAPRALAPALLAGVCALALSACGAAPQSQPLGAGVLEKMIVQSGIPIFWDGGSFHGLAINTATHDPSGAYTIQYGNCSTGGEGVCVTPLEVVTTPDNSFTPGGAIARRTVAIRGVRARIEGHGDTIAIRTGPVVVDIEANRPALARAAARGLASLEGSYLPGSPLPAALPNTGYASKPQSFQ